MIVLGLLFCGNAYAGVNEPGFAPISDWQCSESFSKEYEKLRKAYLKSDKKNKSFSILVVKIVANIVGG